LAEKKGSVGKRIKELREAAGLTQQQLAANAGVSVSIVAQLEQGATANPKHSTITKIANGLGVPVTELVKESE